MCTPFDLRPGVRVRLARLPDSLAVALATYPRLRAGLIGSVGTVQLVTDNKTALVRWEAGNLRAATADCLELVD